MVATRSSNKHFIRPISTKSFLGNKSLQCAPSRQVKIPTGATRNDQNKPSFANKKRASNNLKPQRKTITSSKTSGKKKSLIFGTNSSQQHNQNFKTNSTNNEGSFPTSILEKNERFPVDSNFGEKKETNNEINSNLPNIIKDIKFNHSNFQQRLKEMIEELNLEMVIRTQSMKTKFLNLETEINRFFAIELIKISKTIKSLTMFEFVTKCKELNVDTSIFKISKEEWNLFEHKTIELKQRQENKENKESNKFGGITIPLESGEDLLLNEETDMKKVAKGLGIDKLQKTLLDLQSIQEHMAKILSQVQNQANQ